MAQSRRPQRRPLGAGTDAEKTRKRPVVLGTLSVRVDPTAERMAIDSAIEAGVPLVIANILRLRMYPTTLALVGPEGLNLPHEEDLDAVRATARRAAELGIKTELLRVTTRRPVAALFKSFASATPACSCSAQTCGSPRGCGSARSPDGCAATPVA